ncbi:MAG: hypothetical protein AAGJ35_09500, partial [Myxococcota bacterium]
MFLFLMLLFSSVSCCSMWPGYAQSKTPKGTLGAACSQDQPCTEDFVCVAESSTRPGSFCLQRCAQGETFCSSGERCYALANEDFACGCLRSSDCNNNKSCQQLRCIGAQRQRGEPCDNKAPCTEGLQCVALRNGKQICFALCTPEQACPGKTPCQRLDNKRRACFCQTDQDCPAQHACEQYQCVPKKPGTQEQGQSCDTQRPCKDGLRCARTQLGSTTKQCLVACAAVGERCPTG